MNILQSLSAKKLLSPPKWMLDNVHYMTIMGSVAYGASNDSSDVDIYGFAIPPKDELFPHLRGEIRGFGQQRKPFEQFQSHHIKDLSRQKEYDFTIYSIVKYFNLVMENNPNMIDSLFTPTHCVLHVTKIGQMVRDNRQMFLHRGVWHKFRGYAYSQLNKMRGKEVQGKRKALVDQYGYDVKFAYHLVRLLLEVEQILTEKDLTLNRNGQQLRAIREGEWTQEQVIRYFHDKEKQLDVLYHQCDLPSVPDEAAIKVLLLNCLEEHYGSLNDAVVISSKADMTLDQILAVLQRGGYC